MSRKKTLTDTDKKADKNGHKIGKLFEVKDVYKPEIDFKIDKTDLKVG